ncbi:MAG: alpha-glucosidase family protein [Marinobacter sp.]|uniref:alpha-glucosidase family protein n=1 Tax=Marinobacter sp. TaxID=50741 RepID=UPI0029C4DADB|nr:alpha-glucosidase family protein [Marinobacter sp.]MDX5336656.1 alpha-glucosidase family protein [Marinobacter sp.]MDX5387805.1 alpha-glucosidase family protein [Marinobacter sp.]MDX5439999.1 alpha-glucosidase family protein [Alteromonadaceae bacterium]MDX5473105.1 alpha-glucosidase family protein [Marinobacter sp.]
MIRNPDWWRGAVIYQVYPRSFYDSNGDGVGDLPGVTAKLDYIASLNVDAIWLSPFFTSPMKDFGYDVSDYRNVDPIFGTLKDFDELITEAHKRGLKIMIDQVLSHSSDQHPWFVESRQSRDNPKADWYVWADPKPDGSPPNNWLSVFGGSSWAWDSRRKQYYLHNFLASQPDLNFHNPEVQEQVLSDVKFWLDRGVDGFRLDAINFCFHDRKLRDNPPSKALQEGSIGVRKENPYAYQHHKYDKTQPENLTFLKRLRMLLDQYPGTTTVGEIGDDDSLQTMADYTSGGDKLHMAYSFDLLTEQHGADFFRKTVDTIEQKLTDGWPCWAIGNHDVARVATRWQTRSEQQLKAYMAMLLTLRGSVCIYQGEELGLTEAELRYEDLVDPYGINFWPEYKGRDGCRTPMVWHHEETHGGFSSTSPWLPVYDDHYNAAVALQHAEDNSVLTAYRSFLGWRREQAVLLEGDIEFLKSPKDTLVFIRSLGEERLVIALNLSETGNTVTLPAQGSPMTGTPDFIGGQWHGKQLKLGPWGIEIARL